MYFLVAETCDPMLHVGRELREHVMREANVLHSNPDNTINLEADLISVLGASLPNLVQSLLLGWLAQCIMYSRHRKLERFHL